MQLSKIIVPIDFSEHSEFALETAAILAKQSNAEILALHMLEMSDSLLNQSDEEQQAKAVFFLRIAEKRFQDFLNKDYLNDITITPIVKHFKVFTELTEVAKENNADLVVMGSHGTSGLSEFFVGSNTERVVRTSDIPVLVVKQKPTNLDFKNIVFATNFTDIAIEPYKTIKKFFSSSKISLLNVNVPNDTFKTTTELEASVEEFLGKVEGNLDNLKNVNFVTDFSVEAGVLSFADKVNAGLIVLITNGRRGLAHFFEGSISEDIANHAQRPVLTIKI